MNKKTSIIMLSSLTALSGIAAVSAAFAWFTPRVTITNEDNEISGSSEGAYYEDGDGITKPYVISKPRHLYNLAWLQYLGYYNLPGEKGKQRYFVLKNDIDMSGWQLPPIGTEQYPFIGNFNGQGFTVSNLLVTNTYSEFDRHPSKASSTYFNNSSNFPDIVGFFGVIGDIDNQYTVVGSETHETKAGLEYVFANNEFKNTGLSNITVNTQSTNTLIGMAAGYVNATIANVAVDEGTTTIKNSANSFSLNPGAAEPLRYTQNLSDYGVVGYTADGFKKDIKKAREKLYGVSISPNHEFNASDTGATEGWGGSINMKTIYYRLESLRNKQSTDVTNSFVWRKDVTYKGHTENGVSNYNQVGNPTNTKTGMNTNYGSKIEWYHGYNQTDHEYIGNYGWFTDNLKTVSGSTSATTEEAYMCMTGGHLEKRTYQTEYQHNGYYITDGNNYLSIDSTGGIVNRTGNNGNPPSDASVWTFSSTSGSATIKTRYGTTDYYLINDNGSLKTGSSMNWNVTIDEVNDYMRIEDNSNYRVVYKNGNWTLQYIQHSDITKKTVYYDGNFMTGLSSATNSFGPTVIDWTIDDGKLKNKNTNEYLVITPSNNETITLAFTTNSNDTSKRYFGQTGNYLRTTNTYSYDTSGCNSTTYYCYWWIIYLNGSFTSYRTQNTNQNATHSAPSQNLATLYDYTEPATTGDPHVDNLGELKTIYGPDTYDDSTLSHSDYRMYYTYEDTSYFPLNVEKDVDYSEYQTYGSDSASSNMTTYINKSPNETPKPGDPGCLDPKSSNTGYIISGSNDLPKTGNWTSTSIAAAAIRISEYPMSSLSSSFGASNTTLNSFDFTKIKTLTHGTDDHNVSGEGIGAASATTINALKTAQNSTFDKDYPRFSESLSSFYENSLTSAYDANNKTYTVSSNVYGLHFMDTEISKDEMVNGKNVSVLGNKCDTYEMPVNSINFNLKQKGIVNFFAGSYFKSGSGNSAVQNDSFFSLYEIFRNNDAVQKTDGSGNPINGQYVNYNTIKEIRQIVAIYSNDSGDKTTKYSNIYKYKNADGTYSYSMPYRYDGNQNKYKMDPDNSDLNLSNPVADGEIITGNNSEVKALLEKYINTYKYTLRFTYNQIGKQNSAMDTNYLYYFEFPMNFGEFALGSVKGGTGAYLLYLDIGANAAKTQRTMMYEHFRTIISQFEYPLGVAIVPTSEASPENNNFDPTNTANAIIKKTYVGSLHITRTTTEVEFDSSSGLTNAKPTLIGELMWDDEHEQYNIHTPDDGEGHTTNLSQYIEAQDSFTGEVRRVHLFDYNVNLDDLTVTVITDTKADGETEFTRSFYQKFSNGKETTNFSEMKIYHTTSGVKLTQEEAEDQTLITTFNDLNGNGVLDDGELNTTLIHEIAYLVLDDVDVELVISITPEVDTEITSGRYYKFSAWVMTASEGTGSIEVTVVVFGNGYKLFIGNTEITHVDQTETVTATAPSNQQTP